MAEFFSKADRPQLANNVALTPIKSIQSQFVVQNDFGVSFAVVGNEGDELCRGSTFGNCALANELLLNVGHGQDLLQAL